MKRDYDLIRQILLHFEGREVHRIEKNLQIEGYEKSNIDYHLILMAQAGLIDCETTQSQSTPTRIAYVLPLGLTWDGHEFLDAARDPKIWEIAKSTISNNLKSAPWDTLKAVLVKAVTNNLDL